MTLYQHLNGCLFFFFFFFNDTATTDIYTLSLHDALPICAMSSGAWIAGCPFPTSARWKTAWPPPFPLPISGAGSATYPSQNLRWFGGLSSDTYWRGDYVIQLGTGTLPRGSCIFRNG